MDAMVGGGLMRSRIAAIISEYAHKMLTSPRRKHSELNQKKQSRHVQAQPANQEHNVVSKEVPLSRNYPNLVEGITRKTQAEVDLLNLMPKVFKTLKSRKCTHWVNPAMCPLQSEELFQNDGV